MPSFDFTPYAADQPVDGGSRTGNAIAGNTIMSEYG
jgi:hypothetical protein